MIMMILSENNYIVITNLTQRHIIIIDLLLFADNWVIPFEDIQDLQWLGSGAQGAVFLGRLGPDQVAVKKVRDIKETEIRHLQKLNHPNVIGFK